MITAAPERTPVDAATSTPDDAGATDDLGGFGVAQVSEHALCTFWLNGRLFGLDVADVQEVLRPQPLTAVPTAPDVVVGLMNLRGQIVVCCDLRRRVGLGAIDDPTSAMNLVLRTDDGPTSLLVDAIGDVIRVDGQAVEPTPSTVAPEIARLIVGAHQLADCLLLELATAALLAELTPTD